MKKTIYSTGTLAPNPGHYDRAVRFGDWLFICGTSALSNLQGDLHDRQMVKGIEAQTRVALDNIEKGLSGGWGRACKHLRNPHDPEGTRVFPNRLGHLQGAPPEQGIHRSWLQG